MGPLMGILGRAAMGRLATMPGKLGQAATAAQKLGGHLMAAKDFAMTLAKEIDQTAKEMIHLADAMGGRWVEIEDIAFKTARTMAMSRKQAKEYTQELLSATRDLAAQYGISAREMANFQKTYSEAVGRNIVLTRDQMANMAALAKVTDNVTASQLVENFDKLGIGIERATANIGLMQERAKALGINATKATKIIKDNLRLATTYSFRNGVKDIEAMSLKAASLKMDMSAITGSLDKFRTLEGAITNSAEIQLLGGSIGAAFNNPLSVMYQATSDPKGFMDNIVKSIAGKGTYNEKTGEVTFDPITMYMMREYAERLGMSAEQLNTAAMAVTQNEKVDQELRRNANYAQFSEKDRVAIENLARTNFDEKTGKHYISYLKDGEVHTRNVEDLTTEELKIAKDNQLTQEKLWGDVHDIADLLHAVHGRARGTQSTREREKGLENWWDSLVAWGQNLYMRLVSNTYATATDATGTEHFASGGIVKPIAKAAVGTIVPGDSYYGDKTPVMANAGEMILNTRQQSDLFNFIKSTLYGRNITSSIYKEAGGYDGLKSTFKILRADINKNVGEALKTHVFNFKQFVIKTGLKDKLDEIASGVKKEIDFSKLKDTLSEYAKYNKNLFLHYLKKGAPTLAKAVEKAPKLLKRGEDGVRPITKYAKSIIDSISSYSKTVINKISAKAEALFSKVSSIFENFKNIFTNLYKKTEEMIKPLTDKAKSVYRNAKDVVGKAWDSAKGLWGAAKEQGIKAWSVIKEQGAKVLEQGKKAWSSLKEQGTKAWTAIKGQGTKAWTAAKPVIDKVAKPVAKAVKGAGKFALKKAPYIFEAIEDYFDEKTINKNANERIAKIKKTSESMADKKKSIEKVEKQRSKEINKARISHASAGAGAVGGAAAAGAVGKLIGAGIGTFIGGPVGAGIGGAIGGLAGSLIGGYFGGEGAKALSKKGVDAYYGGNETEIDELNPKAKAKQRNDEVSPTAEPTAEPKATPQQHANDGLIVPGDSYSGDKVPVMANSGEMILSKIQQSKLFAALSAPIGATIGAITALPEVGKFLKVLPSISPSSPTTQLGGKTDINLNVSGTIKLEGNGKTVDFDIAKLLDTPEFKRQLSDILIKTVNENSNSGKYNKESSRINMANQWNTNG